MHYQLVYLICYDNEASKCVRYIALSISLLILFGVLILLKHIFHTGNSRVISGPVPLPNPPPQFDMVEIARRIDMVEHLPFKHDI